MLFRSPRLDRHVTALTRMLAGNAFDEADARRLAGAIAVGLAAALLVRHAPSALADAYCASRLGDGGALGTLSAGAGQGAIIARASQA